MGSFPDLTDGSAVPRARRILADWPKTPLELNFLSVNSRQSPIFHFSDLKSAHIVAAFGSCERQAALRQFWTVRVFFRKAGEGGAFGAVMIRTHKKNI